MKFRELAIELGTLFNEAGFKIYLVGGAVRGALLKEEAKDLDFTTDARPEEIKAVVEDWADSIWVQGEVFGTIALLKDEWSIEITTYRADKYHTESRKPEVIFGTTLAQDLLRRDFTINAIAMSIPDFELIDPFDGVADLKDKTLRTPGTPELSFGDDPLRMLRAVRFIARYGLTPTDETLAAMSSMKNRLSIVSVERISDEFTKILLTDDPATAVRILVETGLMDFVIPEFSDLYRMDNIGHKNIYSHSLKVLNNAVGHEKKYGLDKDAVLRMAALLHDIGKLSTRKKEDGVVSFHAHEVVGARMARKRLRALRYSNDFIDAVGLLIKLHMRFFGFSDWSDAAVRRYVTDAGEELTRLIILTRSDCTTRVPSKAARLEKKMNALEWRIGKLREQENLSKIRPALDGKEIMGLLGLKPGPEVGAAYRFLMDIRMSEGEISKEEASERLLKWQKNH